MDEREAILALSLIPSVGPNQVLRLIEHMGSARAALAASLEQLRLVPGIGAAAETIRSFPWQKALQEELRLLDRMGFSLLVWRDPEYPESLRSIPSPPPVLYLKGTFTERDRITIAIVGSRTTTSYGRAVAERLAFDLAARNLTIVSGMARGIDSAAHRGALASGGRTLAVLGSGLGRIYPPENRALAEKIATSGAVLSEFPILAPPRPENFPRRNRIISGLALGVVVVEAGLQSGALITAGHALEQGREVFAIPGSIASKNSQGCHRLIKEGAKLVESWEDVWEELEPQLPPPPSLKEPSPEEEPQGEEGRLYQLLEAGPLHIDELLVRSELPPSQLASILLTLAMKGFVEELPGKRFVRKL